MFAELDCPFDIIKLPNNSRLVFKVCCNNNSNNNYDNTDNFYCDTKKTEINRNISGMWKTKLAETIIS